MFSVSQTIFKTLLAIALGLVCLFAIDLPAADQGDVGIVKADVLNLRAEPGTDKPVITKLKRGDKVVILGSQNGWLKVVCRAQIGYILDEQTFLTIMKSGEKATDGASAMRAMTLEAGTVKKTFNNVNPILRRLQKRKPPWLTD